MIYGIGTDIISVPRIESSLERLGDDFAYRILSEDERARFHESPAQAQYVASRFAAKEAVFKALGTGLREGMAFTQISVVNDELGKPSIVCRDTVNAMCKDRNISDIHLSLSHEKDNAIAFVVMWVK